MNNGFHPRAGLRSNASLKWHRGLNKIYDDILRTDDLYQRLCIITQGIVDTFGADFCRIWIIKPGDICDEGCIHAREARAMHPCQDNSRCLHLAASSGRYTSIQGTHKRVPFGYYKIGRIASGLEKKFLTNSVTTDSRVHNHKWAESLGLKAFAGYQLRDSIGDTIGVLALFSKHSISQDEYAILENVANTTGYIIQAGLSTERLTKEIEERRRLQNFFRQISAEQKTILQNVNLGIVREQNGYIVWSNDPLGKIMGCRSQDIIGHPIETLFQPGDEVSGILDELRSMARYGLGDSKEILINNRFGKKLWCRLSVSLIDFEDVRKGSIWILEDITQAKKAEIERKEIKKQLLQAQKMEALGTLAGGTAHEFNNLLQAISSYTSWLQNNNRDPKFSKYLSRIQTSVKNAAGLTKSLLSFARTNDGKKTAVFPKTIVKEISILIRHSVDRKITVDVKLPDDLWPIMANAQKIHQALLNLCLNARDAMPDGGHLLIEATNVTWPDGSGPSSIILPPGKYVLFRVKDTGCGIPQELRQHVFEPFFTTKETGKGTGLGLAVVYGIVKAHKGAVYFDSEPGMGSCFQFFIPATEISISGFKRTKQQVKGEGTILLIDDERDVRESLKKIIEMLCYRVLVAEDGQEGLEMYVAGRDEIDLIILDMIMPKLNGSEVLHRLHAMGSQTPVILLTGHMTEADMYNFLSLRPRKILEKPTDLPRLAETIHEILKDSRTIS